jgi:hypothetical protein
VPPGAADTLARLAFTVPIGSSETDDVAVDGEEKFLAKAENCVRLDAMWVWRVAANDAQ